MNPTTKYILIGTASLITLAGLSVGGYFLVLKIKEKQLENKVSPEAKANRKVKFNFLDEITGGIL